MVFGVFVGLRSQKRSPGSGQATLDASMELEEVEATATASAAAGSSAAWNWSVVGRGAAAAGAAAGAAAAGAAAGASSAELAADAPSPPFSNNSLSFLFSASSFSILASADLRLLPSGWPDALAICPRKCVLGRSSGGGSSRDCRVDRRRAAIDAEPLVVVTTIIFVPLLTAAAGRILAVAVAHLSSPGIEQCASVSKLERKNPLFEFCFCG